MEINSTAPPSKRQKIAVTNNYDDAYFKSYEDLTVHAGMIGDSVRTNSYRLALLRCSDQIIGKVVADVGAGTGILSCFCAQAGAKKVYAIEASGVAKIAEEVVQRNKLTDKIQVIRGRIEEVELPEKVDVIVSEWMGYFLLMESMLNSIIYARDKWLKPGGVILPNVATMYLAPIRRDGDEDDDDDDEEDGNNYANEEEDGKFVDENHTSNSVAPLQPDCFDDAVQDEFNVWISVKRQYGVDMSFLGERLFDNYIKKAHVDSIYSTQIIAHPCKLATIDILTVTESELHKIEAKFNFSCYGQAKLHGFVGWFTVSFPCDKEVILSTSPYSLQTHWQQTIMYLRKGEHVEQDTAIDGQISIKPNCKRFLDIDLKYAINDKQTKSQTYFMDGS